MHIESELIFLVTILDLNPYILNNKKYSYSNLLNTIKKINFFIVQILTVSL